MRKSALRRLRSIKHKEELRSFEVEFLGRKKGKLTAVLRRLGSLPHRERMSIGQEANTLRLELLEEINKKKNIFAEHAMQEILSKEAVDITFPPPKRPRGHLHPLTHIRLEAEEIFSSMGFSVIPGGPEVETEYYNFDALNIPSDHPARDLWDTFWISSRSSKVIDQKRKARGRSAFRVPTSKVLLRTHTSSVQVRHMESHQPPIRIIASGKTFRYEATDAKHDTEFIQLECLFVDKNVSVAHLKHTLSAFFQKMFSPKVAIRLRPSYFPFVEPGFEVDMRTAEGEWLEMLGAGMVHQQVLKNAGYIPGHWKGFAFGVGLDRIAMMKYKIPDVRLFRCGDVRFLRQF